MLQSSVQSEGQNTNECTEEMVIDDTISATIVMDQAKTMCDDVSLLIPCQIAPYPANYTTST